MKAVREEEELLSSLDLQRLPRHIAVIMDGNRRWAKARNLPSIMGHRAGVSAFRNLVEACVDLGIEVLTVYAFSKENWKRIPNEVNLLLRLFRHYAVGERKRLQNHNIRFHIIGNKDELPSSLCEEFLKTEEFTASQTGLILNLAVNYSSRDEIINAVNQFIAEQPSTPISAEEFSRRLYTKDLPDPDLLIRTSGEYRISNFLLWQMAYTEFWFTDIFWPDFGTKELFQAIAAYQYRQRRFGGA